MKNRLPRLSSLLASAAFLLLGSTANAAIIDIVLSGDVGSFEDEGSLINEMLQVDLAAALGLAPGSAVHVVGIGWDVMIETEGTSWLEEAVVSFRDCSPACGAADVFLTPGVGDDNPGAATYTSPVLDLVAMGIDFNLDTGVLGLEFFEAFTDLANPDAYWKDGSTISIEAIGDVPEPATLALLSLGLGGLVVRRSRKKRQT